MEDFWEGVYEEEILAQKRPIDSHVQKMNNFIKDHDEKLRMLVLEKNKSLKNLPEVKNFPVVVGLERDEQLTAAELITSDNEMLLKVIPVFVYLCNEIHALKEIAETKFYGAFLTFGFGDEFDNAEFSSSNSKVVAGKIEKMIGFFLPTLQDLSNFISRCQDVLKNFVQQLASVYNPRSAFYRDVYKNVHAVQLFGAIGELLTILITLDCLIDQNKPLLEAWTSFKWFISSSRFDLEALDISPSHMENMEKMIIQLDSKLFSGRIFLDSIQLNFEVQPSDTDIADEVFVSDNSTLLAEMSTCQQLLFHTAFKTTSAHVSKLASFNNINIFRPEYALQRNDVVGAYALYALYRSLLPLQVLFLSIPPLTIACTGILRLRPCRSLHHHLTLPPPTHRLLPM